MVVAAGITDIPETVVKGLITGSENALPFTVSPGITIEVDALTQLVVLRNVNAHAR